MRKLILLVGLILLSLVTTAQSTKSVKTKRVITDTLYIKKIQTGTASWVLVYNPVTNMIEKKYFTGVSDSTEMDPFYRADTSNIAYLNQQNIFTKPVKITDKLWVAGSSNDSSPDSVLTIVSGEVKRAPAIWQYGSSIITESDTSSQILIGKKTYPYGDRLYVWKSGNVAIRGASDNSAGIVGSSYTNSGIWGTSTSGYGEYGSSVSNYGVFGQSTDSVGVFGSSTNKTGISAYSTNGRGLYAYSVNSWAAYINGKMFIKDSLHLRPVSGSLTDSTLVIKNNVVRKTATGNFFSRTGGQITPRNADDTTTSKYNVSTVISKVAGFQASVTLSNARNYTFTRTTHTLLHQGSGALVDTINLPSSVGIDGQMFTICKLGTDYKLLIRAATSEGIYFFADGWYSEIQFYDPAIGSVDNKYQGCITLQAQNLLELGWLIVSKNIFYTP